MAVETPPRKILRTQGGTSPEAMRRLPMRPIPGFRHGPAEQGQTGLVGRMGKCPMPLLARCRPRLHPVQGHPRIRRTVAMAHWCTCRPAYSGSGPGWQLRARPSKRAMSAAGRMTVESDAEQPIGAESARPGQPCLLLEERGRHFLGLMAMQLCGSSRWSRWCTGRCGQTTSRNRGCRRGYSRRRKSVAYDEEEIMTLQSLHGIEAVFDATGR